MINQSIDDDQGRFYGGKRVITPPPDFFYPIQDFFPSNATVNDCINSGSFEAYHLKLFDF